MHWNVNISDLFICQDQHHQVSLMLRKMMMGQTHLMVSSPLTGTCNIYIYAVTFLSLVCVTVRFGKISSCPCACHEFVWESGGVAHAFFNLSSR
jgi:hypothetical protein